MNICRYTYVCMMHIHAHVCDFCADFAQWKLDSSGQNPFINECCTYVYIGA
jgi:hypothetical protein